MAEKQRTIFSKSATERLNSPDDLDRYVRVTNPTVWLLLLACVAAIGGLMAWGFLGIVEEHERLLGCVVNGEAVCFVNAMGATDVAVGDDALVGGTAHMRVKSISEKPLSEDQVTELTGSQFLSDTLVTDRWAYLVKFDGDVTGLSEGVPIQFDVVTDSVAPISFVLGADEAAGESGGK